MIRYNDYNDNGMTYSIKQMFAACALIAAIAVAINGNLYRMDDDGHGQGYLKE